MLLPAGLVGVIALAIAAWSWQSIEYYRNRLRQGLELDVPSLIAVPIDYSVDIGVDKIPLELERQKSREILDELRRRAGEMQRPKEELDYIDRLLKTY